MAVKLVDFDSAALKAVAIDCRQDLFGKFEGNIHSNGLFLGVGIIHANV